MNRPSVATVVCGLFFLSSWACAGPTHAQTLQDPTQPPGLAPWSRAVPAMTVQGIVCRPGRAIAILDDQLAQVGDRFAGREILAITPDGIEYTEHGRQRTVAAPLPTAGCAAGVPAGGPGGGHFGVDLRQAPVRLVFAALSEAASQNILLRSDVTGTISLSLRDVTLRQVLDAIRELNRYDFRKTPVGYLILPATLETRIFHVSYLDVQRYGVSNTQIDSGQITQGTNTQYDNGGTMTTSSTQTPTLSTVGPKQDQTTINTSGTSIITRNNSDFWGSLTTTLRAMVADRPGSSVIVDPQSGMVVVRADPAQLRDIAQYLNETEQAVTRQVVLEAKIIEVDLNSGYQAGVDWSKVLQLGASHYFIGQASPQGAGGFQSNPLNPANVPINVTPGNPISGFVNNSLGGAFTLAADFTNFNAFIQLLSTEGNTHVLSSPRVATLNNQMAIIKAGVDQFYVTGVESQTTTGTATSTSNNVILTPFFSGVALDVTPQITADGEILLQIHPVVSTVTTNTVTYQVDGTPNTLPLAQSTVRESDNIVRTRSGQIVVIGGLMQNSIDRQNYKTPLLGDIPGLGRLFRSEQDQKNKIELVVLLRAIVVGRSGMLADSKAAGKLPQ